MTQSLDLENEDLSPYSKQNLTGTIKNQRLIINQLIDVLAEANEIILNIAGDSEDSDEILGVSKALMHGLAKVAKFQAD